MVAVMCYDAHTSRAGFVATWALSIYMLTLQDTKLPWRYNAWTSVLMMTVALIQLQEYRAWTHLDDDARRRRAAQLLKPTLLLQPAVNVAMCAYVLDAPALYAVAAAYAGWAAHAYANPQPHADIRRGTHGHLAWYGDARTRSHPFATPADKGLYLLGLCAPLALAAVAGHTAYGVVMLATLFCTLVYSLVMYPLTESSSMWCFWGLVYTGMGFTLNL